MIKPETLKKLGFQQDGDGQWRASGVDVLVYLDGEGYAIDMRFGPDQAAMLRKEVSWLFEPFDPKETESWS